MKILITIPSFARHGGIRVILEWATRLSKLHQVSLHCEHHITNCDWFDVSHIPVGNNIPLRNFDCIICTSPHSVHLLGKIWNNPKVFLFCQMLEHLFRPGDKAWLEQCRRFYTAPYPMFYISRWNHAVMTAGFERDGSNDMYIGNGVNLDHFPISRKPKDGKTILVEGWECSNPTKDVHYVAPRVAARLKKDGYHILAYGSLPLTHMPEACDEYFYNPTTEQMNDLYERATIMLKASRYDARSCAPVEAMTKGTVTVRSAWFADDDLLNYENCVRCDYDADVEAMYDRARMLLEVPTLRESLAHQCYSHVINECNWDAIIGKVNKKITE